MRKVTIESIAVDKSNVGNDLARMINNHLNKLIESGIEDPNVISVLGPFSTVGDNIEFKVIFSFKSYAK